MKQEARAAGEPINIGRAAALSGVSPKMVRHYESLGLLPVVRRSEGGYRQYRAQDVHNLRFIRRARDLGFSMAEIAELLKLWRNRRRASADVKRIALAHAADLQRRIDEMTAMRRTLERLADCCHGDARPDCPILDELADAEPADARLPGRPDADGAPPVRTGRAVGRDPKGPRVDRRRAAG